MSNKVIAAALTILFLSSFSSIASAVDISKMDSVQREFYIGQMNYYNSIKTCQKRTIKLPGIVMFGQKINMTYYILGRKNGKCSIREYLGNSDIRCELPNDVAKKYAEDGIKTLNEGGGMPSYINQIINDTTYCQQN